MNMSAVNKNSDGLSIVIPAYNEEGCIRVVVSDIQETLSRAGCHAEIIVVDDASDDATGAKAREAGARVISHEVNRGYGASIKTGIRHAAHDSILIIDGDGTYPCAQIPELLNWRRTSDMVVGARTTREANIPFSRRPAKWLLNKLANYLTGTKIPDLNSGMRLFRREAFERFLHLLPSGFSFTTTLTLAMLCNDYVVTYVPISYHKRTGKSKIRPIPDTTKFLQLIIRTVLYFRPLQVFVPIGFVLVLIALGVLLYSYYFQQKVMDVTVIVLVLAALNVFTIGLLADLIDKRLQG